MRFHDAETVDATFLTCCILHNMLLEEDDMCRRWEHNVDYLNADGHHEAEDMPRVFSYAHERQCLDTDTSSIGRGVRTHEDNGAAPTAVSTLSEIEVEYEPSHSGLVKKFIEHFWYHWNVCKDITWV
jgi:hypothetical protein